MRKLLVFTLLAVSTAEKYALIFGTADHWSNYCITSVFAYFNAHLVIQ